MTICIESLFSLPESWNATGTQYSYAACLPMTVGGEVITKFVIIRSYNIDCSVFCGLLICC